MSTSPLKSHIIFNTLLLIGSLLTLPLKGHEVRPLLVEVQEVSTDQFTILINYPEDLSSINYPKVTISDCPLRQAKELGNTQLYNCQQVISSNRNLQLQVFYPSFNPGYTTALRVQYLNEQPLLLV